MVRCDGEDSEAVRPSLYVQGQGVVPRAGTDTSLLTCLFSHRTPWLEQQGAERPAALCHFVFRKESTQLLLSGPPEPSRRQGDGPSQGLRGGGHGPGLRSLCSLLPAEMVLPSSCLGLGPRTSSSPSSSDSRICCTRNHHTTRLRNRLQKVGAGAPSGSCLPACPPPPRPRPHVLFSLQVKPKDRDRAQHHRK